MTHGTHGTHGTTLDSTAASIVSPELTAGLPARELEGRLVRVARGTDVGHRELAFYLADMDARGVHQLLGYAGAAQFAEQRLEIGRRSALELIAVGRALEELPRIDAAFREGRLRWARVRLLARVARPGVEDAWLQAALALSWRDLERTVLTSEPGRAPRQDALGLPVVKVLVRAKVASADYERFELARRKLGDERGEPVDEAEFLTLAADLILGSRADGLPAGREPVDDSLYRVAVTRCRTCRRSSMATDDGPLALTEAETDRIDCDAAVHDDGAHEHGELAPKTPLWLRRHVLTRDGGRCRSCRSTRSINVHHIAWRSAGGATTAANLLALCSRCHALVHERLLLIDGETQDEAVFCNRDGTPLSATSRPIPPVEGAAVAASLVPELGPASAPASAPISALVPVPVPALGGSAPTRVGFGDLPTTVDAAWFFRHAHLFRWNERRGELSFEAGVEAPPIASDSFASQTSTLESIRGARPDQLADLVGQEDVKALLLPAITAAGRRDRSLDHALFFGPPGTGKSTVARLVAAALGTRAKTVNGPNLADPGVLLRLLCSLGPRDVLFIDEVHAAPRRLLESLYEAMEERCISFAVGDGHHSKTLSIVLSPFTLIAATTEAGVLPEAFESRFGLRACFAPYSEDELSVVVSRAAAHESAEIDPDAALTLARAARGSAREAHALLRRALDAASSDAASPDAHLVQPLRVDVAAASSALRALTIDGDGLRAVERRALIALRSSDGGRPMGLARWAAAAGLPIATLRHVCEPALLRGGFIDVGPGGRRAVPLRRVG